MRFHKTAFFPFPAMCEKILVAFDFDHTLIDDNSDLYVRKLAPGGKLPQYIKDQYRYCFGNHVLSFGS